MRDTSHISGQRMKRVLLILSASLMMATGRGESLRELYAAQGTLLLTHLRTAPFPHPERAKGHEYQGKFYDVAGHYSNDTVAIFIPKGFRQTGEVDFVVHFHGWLNNVEAVLRHYELIEQLVASRRNAVLVVPQGPYNAPDSFGGKLEDLNGFARFMKEVANCLTQTSAVKFRPFSIGNIILSGHSGGYHVISSILERGGCAEQVKEVWLFDALYGQTDKFLAWWDKCHGRLLDIYTEHGGTKEETENLMRTLKQRDIPLIAGKEAGISASDLSRNRLLFLYSDLAHDEVVHKHRCFQQFLSTSVLQRQ